MVEKGIAKGIEMKIWILISEESGGFGSAVKFGDT